MDLTDPAQWHAYTYANNNPTTYSDPTGLAPETGWTLQYYNPVPPAKPTSPWDTGGYYTPAGYSQRPTPDDRPGSQTPIDVPWSGVSSGADGLEAFADRAVAQADHAADASRDLRNGLSQGGYNIGQYRLNPSWQRLKQFGQMPWVKTVSRTGGVVTVPLGAGIDYANNYYDHYADLEEGRIGHSVGRTVMQTAGSLALAASFAVVAVGLCATGVGCAVVVAGAAAVGSYAGSAGGGSLYDAMRESSYRGWSMFDGMRDHLREYRSNVP